MKQGYALKFDRARHHLDEINLHAREWRERKGHSIIHEEHPHGPHQSQLRVVVEPVPIYPLALILGDFLFNLRSCLDQLAFSLAVDNGATEEIAHEIEFPIYTKEQVFRERGLRRIAALNQCARAEIERLQPYHAGNIAWCDWLAVLHRLNNIDKHRLLHPVVCAYDAFRGRSRNVKYLSGPELFFGPVEQEAVVARYTAVPRNPDEQMHVNLEPALDVAVLCGEAGDWRIGLLCRFMLETVRRAILMLEPCFTTGYSSNLSD